ncbi:transposase [Streptomyces ossamyceticus]|nr:transposase [Streptomyces ossamyceticus]
MSFGLGGGDQSLDEPESTSLNEPGQAQRLTFVLHGPDHGVRPSEPGGHGDGVEDSKTPGGLFRTCAGLVEVTLGLLARRIRQLSDEVRDLEGRLTRLVLRHAPQLLEVVGIGPDTAVTLLITVGDNPQRLGSEASFAALCGVSPVERSSGTVQS